MRVLFDHDTPFLLAHGGFQTQIEHTRRGLEQAGVEVDWLRWWDDKQTGDLIHFFGRPTAAYVTFAHQKKMKVVVGELLTGLASRTPVQRRAQKLFMIAARSLVPAGLLIRLSWETYQVADAFIATPWEAQLMVDMFGAPPTKVHPMPINGVEEDFLHSTPATRGPWLVCTATITARKRVLELAHAAMHAKTPLWVIGVPYSSDDPYAQQFLTLAAANPKLIRYEGGIRDRIELSRAYRRARGFVLLSDRESLSLSALEAAACECPLLLSDLPWARCFFGDRVEYCPLQSVAKTAERLRTFYDRAPELAPPPCPASWAQVGQRLREVYEGVLGWPPVSPRTAAGPAAGTCGRSETRDRPSA